MIRKSDIERFLPGQKLVRFLDGGVHRYEFICVHPHNSNYIILLNTWTELPERVYCTTLVQEFGLDHSDCIVLNYYHNRYEEEFKNISKK